MKKSSLIFFMCLLVACESNYNTITVPENLITEQKFTDILEDLMILEHQIQTDYPQIDRFQKVMKKSSLTLFKKYHINKDEFDASFEYYASDQVKMKLIYAAILERMNKKLSKLELNKP